jgi:hypothetical protein
VCIAGHGRPDPKILGWAKFACRARLGPEFLARWPGPGQASDLQNVRLTEGWAGFFGRRAGILGPTVRPGQARA